MGYRKIENLYRNKDILLFKQCLALEKIHGTSTHIQYTPAHNGESDKLTFFSGGCKYDQFVNIFNQEELLVRFRENAANFPEANITIYGEGYGGKMQAMSDTYGKELKFIAFEVKINNDWLGVHAAHRFVEKIGLEFVHYDLIDTTEEAINGAMMADSVQAVRNGCGPGHMREGIVLRPTVELIYPNGGRVICKHKRPEFAEREHTPKFSDPKDLKVLENAKEIATEWVTPMRLVHILDKMPSNPSMENMKEIIAAMQNDIAVEASGEVVLSKEALKAIASKTVELFKGYLKECRL